jgi:hypothetical protein
VSVYRSRVGMYAPDATLIGGDGTVLTGKEAIGKKP